MNSANTQIPTFVGGEVSPRILARSDIERFPISSQRLENFWVRTQGPITRRRGSQLVTSPVTIPSRLMGYTPSRDDAHIMLVQAGKITIVTQTI